MKEIYSEIRRRRREAKKIADVFKRIKESKNGLLKLVGTELISIVVGASFGGLGRVTGAHWIPAVPIGMDLMHNAVGYSTKRGLWELAKYGFGVALPYTDKIYLTASQNLPELLEVTQSFIDKI